MERLAAGELPDFLPETAPVRDDPDWRVAEAPADLQDRRVEITGPVERKMMINALNSGASVFMADFEDANSPTWENCVQGQANLIDAVERTISLETPREELLAERRDRDAARPAARLAPAREARARRRRAGLGAACSTSACTCSTAPSALGSAGSGPYFYLPKLESHLEARLWNDVFVARAGAARRCRAGRSARPS